MHHPFEQTELSEREGALSVSPTPETPQWNIYQKKPYLFIRSHRGSKTNILGRSLTLRSTNTDEERLHTTKKGRRGPSNLEEIIPLHPHHASKAAKPTPPFTLRLQEEWMDFPKALKE